MRVVLDTNSLLASIPRKSFYRPIFDAIIEGQLTLLISNEILSEYAEIIEQKTNVIVSSNICEFLTQSNFVEQIEIYFKWHLIERDVDDDKFVDCAVSGNADYIVTDDKHFEVLASVKFPFLKVLKTAEFLEIISEV
jgi:putative PIN family toxin of toxin-antitoxin system